MSSGHAYSFPSLGMRMRILPKAYDKSERLALDLWDHRRLASHVLATLSPVEQRAAAVNLILKTKITGSFLARYTHEIEELLPDGDCELVRAIARTIPKIFWVPLRAPRVRLTGSYASLREIEDVLSEAPHVEGDVEVASPTIASESAEVSWSYDDDAEEDEGEKAEVEAHPDADSEADLGILDPVLGEGDAAAPADDDDPRTAERHDEDADDESSRGGTRGPADGRQRLGGARRSAGDGSANHNHNHNTPYTLWSQISLAARRVGSRRFMLASASGTSWHLGSSNFFVGPRDEDEDEDEDDTVPERGTGSGRAGARSWPRGGSVVHGCEWMLRCVGLYGV